MSLEKANLIVHIGPPKTATTSLQIAFERNLPASFAFLGAYQPRERNTYNRCHILNNMVLMDKNSCPEDLDDFLEIVEENKANEIISLVVEEVLMDGSQKMDWHQKIRNLAEVLAHVDATPAITLRHPLDGIPSIQREYAGTLGFIQRRSILSFLLHPQSRVFDYRHVLETLKFSGFKEICLFSFFDLTKNGLNFSKISKRRTEEAVLKIGEHNTSLQKDKRSRTGSKVLLYFVRRWVSDFLKLEQLVLQNSSSSVFLIDDALSYLDEPTKSDIFL